MKQIKSIKKGSRRSTTRNSERPGSMPFVMVDFFLLVTALDNSTDCQDGQKKVWISKAIPNEKKIVSRLIPRRLC
jgi:hypothetical protein